MSKTKEYLMNLVKGSSKMMSYGFISQLITLLAILLLTGYLNPTAFGLYGIYMAYTSLIAIFIVGKFELALLETEDKSIRAKILILCIFTIFISSVIGFLVMTILLTKLGLSKYWFFIIMSSTLSGILSVFKILQASDKLFNIYQNSLIIQAISFSSMSWLIVFYFQDYADISLIIGHFTGLFFSVTLVVLMYKSLLVDVFKNHLNLNEIKKYAYKFKDFPLKALPTDLVMLIPQSIVIFVSYFFGTSIAGFYTLCQRVILTPFIFIGAGLGEFIRSDISIRKRSGNSVKKELNLFLLLIFFIGVLTVLACYFILPYLIREFLSDNYAPLENYLKILSIGLISQGIVMFTSFLWPISNKKQLGLTMLGISQTFPLLIFVFSNLIYTFDSYQSFLILSLSIFIFALLPTYFIRHAFK